MTDRPDFTEAVRDLFDEVCKALRIDRLADWLQRRLDRR